MTTMVAEKAVKAEKAMAVKAVAVTVPTTLQYDHLLSLYRA